jgi:hypothetical protein
MRKELGQSLLSTLENQPQTDQGTLARIFSISEAVKARNVCVRMLPSISAASNTLAAVSRLGHRHQKGVRAYY